jgi:hypothetical protein
MDTDLLVNPKVMGTTSLESIDLPTLNFDDVGSGSSAPAPKLVTSFEDSGPAVVDGMPNFNAEPYVPAPARHTVSEDVVMREKYEMLRKFERLSKLGVPMRKRFTLESSMEEMKLELEFIRREKSMDATIKQFSEWFVTGMSAMEWGSKNVMMMRAFGLQLDGLSEAAQMNVADLEDDFEELYDLYGENMKMHPLVRIPLRTCMMIYMVHLTNQMAQKAPIPNIQDIMRQNPDIARSLAAASMQAQTQQMRGTASVPPPQNAPNPLAGLMSFMQQTVPSGPPPNIVPKQPAENKPIRVGAIRKPAPPPAPAPAPAPVEMRPPPNIDDLLKDINSNAKPATPKATKGRKSTGASMMVKL